MGTVLTKNRIRLLLVRAVGGSLLLGEQVSEAIALAREGIEDIMAEVQFRLTEPSQAEEVVEPPIKLETKAN